MNTKDFTYLYCWLILKDVLRWVDVHANVKRTTPMKYMFDTSQFEIFGIDQGEIKIVNINLPTIASSKCLTSCKANEEVEKISKLKEKMTITQAKTTTYMVVSTLKKTNILEDQSVMAISPCLKICWY
jgi:hypothetical protein